MEIAAIIERIKAAIDPRGWIADPRDREPCLKLYPRPREVERRFSASPASSTR